MTVPFGGTDGPGKQYMDDGWSGLVHGAQQTSVPKVQSVLKQ